MLGESRINLITALAWTGLAGVLERHHVHYHWSLQQIHPGNSMGGLLQLELRPSNPEHDDGRVRVLRLMLGGPDPGSWQADYGMDDDSMADDGSSLWPLLSEQPEALIDHISMALGLIAPWQPQQTLPADVLAVRVLAVRVLAGLMANRVFVPANWRITLGLLGWWQDVVCQWHQAAHGLEGRALDLGDRERLCSLALLHRCSGGINPMQGWPDHGQAALLVDLLTGQAQVLRGRRAGDPLDLVQALAEQEGNLPALLRRIEALLE